MKRFLSFALGVLAASVLMLCATACDDDFNPNKKEDFIGTTWKAQDDEANYTLSFKKDHVTLRTTLKNADKYYVVGGDYDFYPETSRVQITFSGIPEEKHNIDPNLPYLFMARGIIDGEEMHYADEVPVDGIPQTRLEVVFHLD